jgi:uncharacterized protein with von Willebrand factor type A (vWA) domain
MNINSAVPIVAAGYAQRYGVDIVIGGPSAYTDGETIYLPTVKNLASNTNVLWGYLAHEAAHVAYSDFNALIGQTGLCVNLANVIEDYRIETKMMHRYRGCRTTINATWAYIKSEHLITVPDSNASSTEVLVMFTLLWMRAFGMKQPFQPEFLQVEAEFNKHFPASVRTKIEVILLKALDAISTECSFNTAHDIISMLEEEDKKTPEKGSQNEDENQDEGQTQTEDKSQQSGADSDDDDSSSPGDNHEKPGNGNSSESSESEASADITEPSETGTNPSTGSGASDALAEPSKTGVTTEGIKDVLADLDTSLEIDPMSKLIENIQSDDYSRRMEIPTNPSIESSFQDIGRINSQVNRSINSLRSELIGLVQSSSRKRTRYEDSGHKIAANRIHRVVTHDYNIFQTKSKKIMPDSAIHLLTDYSGSMSGQEEVAASATLALAKALEPINGVTIACSNFYNYTSYQTVRIVKKRNEPVSKCLNRFLTFAQGGTPMGEGLMYALLELSQQREKRKQIIIITDGAANDDYQVHKAVQMAKQYGVEIFAIGISSSYVENYFDNFAVINSVNELRGALIKLAKKIII